MLVSSFDTVSCVSITADMSFFGQTLHYSKLTAGNAPCLCGGPLVHYCKFGRGIFFRIVCMSFSVLEQKAWGRIVFSVAPGSQAAMVVGLSAERSGPMKRRDFHYSRRWAGAMIYCELSSAPKEERSRGARAEGR
jgi:hypothetical protein